MAAQLKIYHTTAAKLDQLQIKNGQLIIVDDTHMLYLDMNNIRNFYGSIDIDAYTKEEVDALIAGAIAEAEAYTDREVQAVAVIWQNIR